MLALLLCAALMACILPGCQTRKADPKTEPTHNSANKQSKPPVPLRVWFVGDAAAQQLIERQWQATSERPLQLSMQTTQTLSESSKLSCDVIVFPVLMLGELIDRGWLIELPAALQSPSQTLSGDNATIGSGGGGEPAVLGAQPASWLEQSRYGRQLWGVSLSATIPIVLSNFPFPEAFTRQPTNGTDEARTSHSPTSQIPQSQAARSQTKQSPPGQSQAAELQAAESLAAWRSLVDALKENTNAPHRPKDQSVSRTDDGSTDRDTASAVTAMADPDAVCDRFMVVLASICQRDARFGMVFDPETLKPRLTEPESIDAAELLWQLHQANGSPTAMLGGPEAAWAALAETEMSVTIGLPPATSPEVDQVTSIEVALPPLSPAPTGARNTQGWNSGHGLVAALTSDCRQTSQAIEFTRWLTSDPTRGVLGKRLVGLASESTFAPSSSAWQAQRMARRLAQQSRLPNEPRLPHSFQFRRSLGEHLIRMLRGELTPEQALNEAAGQWEQITAGMDRAKLRSSYERSLGL